MTSFLIKHGADTEVRDNQGYHVLHLSLHSGNYLLTLYLLSLELNPNVQDPRGCTPLIWAAYQGSPEATKYLVENGASIDMQDHQGYTALYWAVTKGYFNVVTKLVELGARADIADKNGKTPRDLAVERDVLGDYEWAIHESFGFTYNMYLNDVGCLYPSDIKLIFIRNEHIKLFTLFRLSLCLWLFSSCLGCRFFGECLRRLWCVTWVSAQFSFWDYFEAVWDS